MINVFIIIGCIIYLFVSFGAIALFHYKVTCDDDIMAATLGFLWPLTLPCLAGYALVKKIIKGKYLLVRIMLMEDR
jgi:hypothetical protein